MTNDPFHLSIAKHFSKRSKSITKTQMKLRRYPTEAEWQEIVKEGPGVRMYKGKKTFFYNGEILWDDENDENDEYLIYDEEDQEPLEVIIVLPGVEVIPNWTFARCSNIKTVIMSDSVKSIEQHAFDGCKSLVFVKLSQSLEYIRAYAFSGCGSLTSIFIPDSCRQIDEMAFLNCKELIIVYLPRRCKQGKGVFRGTAVLAALSNTNYSVKNINGEEAYALHQACASFNLSADMIYALVKEQGTINGMRMPNAIGITPSQYLEANPISDISEKEIIKRFILETMGETV